MAGKKKKSGNKKPYWNQTVYIEDRNCDEVKAHEAMALVKGCDSISEWLRKLLRQALVNEGIMDEYRVFNKEKFDALLEAAAKVELENKKVV